MSRGVVIHGHFYQPPRENPWLEAVEIQDSAAPHHDWNVRVTDQCYAPNTAARRVDDRNRIFDVVNNFEKISFNVGPTLMEWLARCRPDVLAKIVEADRLSLRARGHGNALAQVYNHMIMPLATRRDRVTQVRWGIEDFRRWFGRAPEGMWLPETAVDDESLEVLAEAGLAFTILAPHQAWRVRPLDGDEGTWQEVGEAVDPRRPYRWRGPRGHTLALFFYDGPISRAIAFGDLLERGERLAGRLREAFDDRPTPQLVHVATDGESYGHHRPFGEMALAAALSALEADPTIALTNYAAWLAQHPPADEVQIHERTSWSCAHGVERWRGDCGCRLRPDWHQRWRGPLRQALDELRDAADAVYEARAGALFKDPWAARDAYGALLPERRPAAVEAFLAAHQRAPLDAEARLEARRLLEMQRHRLLMYTSCGWFFDDISGLEAVQILRYAARVIQYLAELNGGRLEEAFVQRLAAAPSNVAELGDGAGVYRRLVRPSVVDLRRVAAHYAISNLVDPWEPDTEVYAWRLQRLDEAREASGGTLLGLGHIRVTAHATGETLDLTFAALHFGGHDFVCGVRAWEGIVAWERLRADLLERYTRRSVLDVVRGLAEHFPGEPFGLTDLFLEERRQVLTRVIQAALDRHEDTFRYIWDDNRKLLHHLRSADARIPEILGLVARHVLERQIHHEVRQAPALGAIPERVVDLVTEARALGLTLDLLHCRPVMAEAVQRLLTLVADAPTPERVGQARALLAEAGRLGFHYGHWDAQTRFWDIWRTHAEARAVLVPLAEVLGFALEP